MDFLSGCGFVFFLAAVGIVVFSLAAGFAVYPALRRKLYDALSSPFSGAAAGDAKKGGLGLLFGIPIPGEAIETRNFILKFRGKNISGRLFMLGKRTVGDTSLEHPAAMRILIVAPEPETSCAGLSADKTMVAARMQSDAVFIPSPAEKFSPAKAFSFGVREGKALYAWRVLLGGEFPRAEFSLYGKCCGAAAVLFCASRESKRKRTRGGSERAGGIPFFSTVTADCPYFSVSEFVKTELAAVFSGNIRRRLVYAGVYAASLFAGTPLFKQRPCAAVEKICRRRKRMKAAADPRGAVFVSFSCGMNAGLERGERNFFLTQYYLYNTFFSEKKKEFCDIFPLKEESAGEKNLTKRTECLK